MLARLSERLPGIRTLVGTGEHLPLPDASMDAVVFGQAWHWVDPPRASAEVARVLRPGGTLGLIWNIRDEAEPWVRELTDVMHTSDAEELIAAGGPVVGEPFGPLEHATFRWTGSFTRRLARRARRVAQLHHHGDAGAPERGARGRAVTGRACPPTPTGASRCPTSPTPTRTTLPAG